MAPLSATRVLPRPVTIDPSVEVREGQAYLRCALTQPSTLASPCPTRGLDSLHRDDIEGAARFAAGAGRPGTFG